MLGTRVVLWETRNMESNPMLQEVLRIKDQWARRRAAIFIAFARALAGFERHWPPLVKTDEAMKERVANLFQSLNPNPSSHD